MIEKAQRIDSTYDCDPKDLIALGMMDIDLRLILRTLGMGKTSLQIESMYNV